LFLQPALPQVLTAPEEYWFLRRVLLIHKTAKTILNRLSPILLSLFLLSCAANPIDLSPTGDNQARVTVQSPSLPANTAPVTADSTETRLPPKRTSPAKVTRDVVLPSATLPASQSVCSQKKGTIENGMVESDLLDYDLKFRIYLPPCYAMSPETEYPTLYLFHGQGYRDSQWDELGADEIVDKLIASNQVAPFIMVMPYEQLNNSSKSHPFDRAVIEELLPFIEHNYRTIREREGRAVGGISHGGGWAIELGITHWEVFGALGAHSPAVLNNNPVWFGAKIELIPANQIPRIFIDLGDREPPEISESARWFGDLLDEKGMPHEWHQFTGEHNQEYWQNHLEIYLRWYASSWH
jgi:enterochelin esterase-like enzyme